MRYLERELFFEVPTESGECEWIRRLEQYTNYLELESPKWPAGVRSYLESDVDLHDECCTGMQLDFARGTIRMNFDRGTFVAHGVSQVLLNIEPDDLGAGVVWLFDEVTARSESSADGIELEYHTELETGSISMFVEDLEFVAAG